MTEIEEVKCCLHGKAYQTFVCKHLVGNPAQTWYSTAPNPENEWPDSWCSVCHVAYLREGQWNEKNECGLDVKLLCHHCYEDKRALGGWVEVPEGELQE